MNTYLILHDIRSTHNVGSILRTADGFGVIKVYIGGYTPYPEIVNDTRLPHIRTKLSSQIAKTALGAEKTMHIELYEDITTLLQELKGKNIHLVALEQSAHSKPISELQRPTEIAIILGREVEGIDPEVIAQCDEIVEIPMQGQKESFNVSVAAAIVMYELSR